VRGKFITVEGGEGVGKTTNITFIQKQLSHNGVQVVLTREPGGTDVAEKIRDLLLAHHDEELDPTAELLLVFAARAQHIKRVIEPALARGNWVLCDRFTDATYAYQGGGRGLNIKHIAQLEALVQDKLQPDVTILLDIEPKIGLERASQRAELDRFEVEPSEFFDKVRESYLDRAQQQPERFRLVDASQSLQNVQRQLADILNTVLAHNNG